MYLEFLSAGLVLRVLLAVSKAHNIQALVKGKRSSLRIWYKNTLVECNHLALELILLMTLPSFKKATKEVYFNIKAFNLIEDKSCGINLQIWLYTILKTIM